MKTLFEKMRDNRPKLEKANEVIPRLDVEKFLKNLEEDRDGMLTGLSVPRSETKVTAEWVKSTYKL